MIKKDSREEGRAFFNNDDILSGYLDLADAEICSIVDTNETKQQEWTEIEDISFGL